jgi:hypothetical protein
VPVSESAHALADPRALGVREPEVVPDQTRASTTSSTTCEKRMNWRVTPPEVVPLKAARSLP